MTKQTEALKELLEIVEHAIIVGDWKVDGACDPEMIINACKEALEQPAQEPVAWMDEEGIWEYEWESYSENKKPLYTRPAPAWKGLSEEEMMKLANKYIDLLPNGEIFHFDLFARAIEQELKTKNGFSELKEKNT